MDWLSSLFLGAFFFGLLFCVGTVLLGLGSGGPDGVGLEPEGGGGAEGSESGAPVSPWNLTALTAFVAWFGGAGYLALTAWQLGVWPSLLLALLGGLVGWAAVIWFYRRVLGRGAGRMDPADYQLEGVVARVSGAMSGDRVGEIRFKQSGALRSAGARSLDGAALAAGTEVVIVRYERGIAYVLPWDAYVESEAPKRRPGGS